MAPTDLPMYRDEKACLTHEASANPVTNSASVKSCCKAHKMSSARKCCLGLMLLLSVTTLGLATATVSGTGYRRGCSGMAEGQAVVDGHDSGISEASGSAPPDTLHKLLHSYFPDSFKHGVFSSDEDALEAAQSQDATVASSMIELAKRQGDNSSTAAGGSVSTHVVTEESTETATVTQTPDASPTSKPETKPQTTPETKPDTSAPTTTAAPPTTTKAPETTEKPTQQPTTTQPPPSPSDSKPTTTANPPTAATTTDKPADPPATTTTANSPPPANQPGTTTTAKTAETSNVNKPGTSAESTTQTQPTTIVVTSSPTAAAPVTITMTKDASLVSSTPQTTPTSPGTSPGTSPSEETTSTAQGTTMATQTVDDKPRTTSSRTSTFVSTLPGGAQTTITTVEIVTGSGEAAAATPTADGNGGALQTGNPAPYLAAPVYKAMAGAVALGGAFLM